MKPDNLDQIYQMYVNDVYRYLYSLCLQHHTAEDLMQETFYRAYLYLENCKDEKVKPWLFRVAYNAFVDFKRKDSRSFTSESEFFDGIGDEGKLREENFLKTLKLMQTYRSITKQIVPSFKIDEAINYLEANGVKLYGAVVTGPTKELLKLQEEAWVKTARVGEVRLWNWDE